MSKIKEKLFKDICELFKIMSGFWNQNVENYGNEGMKGALMNESSVCMMLRFKLLFMMLLLLI